MWHEKLLSQLADEMWIHHDLGIDQTTLNRSVVTCVLTANNGTIPIMIKDTQEAAGMRSPGLFSPCLGASS
jgi:hypothetical protein